MDGYKAKDGSLVFSLTFELESQSPGGSSTQLIAPLNSEGNGRFAKPVDRRKRLVVVGPGDWIKHRGCSLRVLSRSVYRSTTRPTGPL